MQLTDLTQREQSVTNVVTSVTQCIKIQAFGCPGFKIFVTQLFDNCFRWTCSWQTWPSVNSLWRMCWQASHSALTSWPLAVLALRSLSWASCTRGCDGLNQKKYMSCLTGNHCRASELTQASIALSILCGQASGGKFSKQFKEAVCCSRNLTCQVLSWSAHESRPVAAVKQQAEHMSTCLWAAYSSNRPFKYDWLLRIATCACYICIDRAWSSDKLFWKLPSFEQHFFSYQPALLYCNSRARLQVTLVCPLADSLHWCNQPAPHKGLRGRTSVSLRQCCAPIYPSVLACRFTPAIDAINEELKRASESWPGGHVQFVDCSYFFVNHDTVSHCFAVHAVQCILIWCSVLLYMTMLHSMVICTVAIELVYI